MSETLIFGLGSIVPRLTTFVTVLLFSRVLAVSDFGLYVLAVSIGEMCDTLTSGWFRTGFLRFYHRGRLNGTEIGLDIGGPLLFSCACMLAAPLFAAVAAKMLVPTAWSTFAIGVALYTAGSGAAQMAMNVLRGEGKPFGYLLMSSRQVLGLVAGLVACKTVGATFASCTLAVFGTQAVIGIAALTTLWWGRRGQERDPYLLGTVLTYAWPLVFTNVVAALTLASDRSLLQLMLGAQAVALYGAAFSVARQPIEILAQALNLGLFSRLAQVHDDGDASASAKMLGRAIVQATALVLPAAIGLSLLAGPIIRVLFDARYWDRGPTLVRLIAVAAMLMSLKNYSLDIALHLTRRTGMHLVTYLPAMVTIVALGVPLITVGGIYGAGVTVLLGAIAGLVASFVAAHRVLAPAIALNELGKIGLACLGMALAVSAVAAAPISDVARVSAGVLAGALLYGALMYALDALGVRTRAGGRPSLRPNEPIYASAQAKT